MPAEVPDWISSITPVVTTVTMVDYSQEGVLFPNETQAHRFVMDTYKLWRRVPERGNKPPHILVFTFDGIDSFNPTGTRDALMLIWGKPSNNTRELYAVFDQIEPWQAFQDAVPVPSNITRSRVVTARRAGGENYELVGDPRKVFDYRGVFSALQEEEPWIDGIDFSQRRLDPPNPTVLSRMHREGLLIQHQHAGGRAYYRTLAG